ncbi:MAG: hypothetical protein RLZZ468_1868, partial [Cyanobacteriota bacterium]
MRGARRPLLLAVALPALLAAARSR